MSKETNGCGKKHVTLACCVLGLVVVITLAITAASQVGNDKIHKETKASHGEVEKRTRVLENNSAANKVRFETIQTTLGRIEDQTKERDIPLHSENE